MSSLGARTVLLMGPVAAVPVPITISEAIKSIEVSHSDTERSGFKITFKAKRSGLLGIIDYPLLINPLLRAGNRVIILVLFNFIPKVLMDGLITHVQLEPGEMGDDGVITVMGEDLTVAMDKVEKMLEYPAQSEFVIANRLIAGYAQYGLIPIVHPSLLANIPSPTDRIPVQHGTDLQYLQNIAKCHGFVFYITSGPLPFANTAYLGPPRRIGLMQRALSVNLGPYTNVSDINFRYDALEPVSVFGVVQDSKLNKPLPIKTFISKRFPLSLNALFPPMQRQVIEKNTAGLNYAEAQLRAQATMDRSRDKVVVAEGELDTGRYCDILTARGSVGVRGAGFSYDGLYYVKKVHHYLSSGEYKQKFTLTRDGTGTSVPLIRGNI